MRGRGRGGRGGWRELGTGYHLEQERGAQEERGHEGGGRRRGEGAQAALDVVLQEGEGQRRLGQGGGRGQGRVWEQPPGMSRGGHTEDGGGGTGPLGD